jgi:hypothetical protein
MVGGQTKCIRDPVAQTFQLRFGGRNACAAGTRKRQPQKLSTGPPQRATTRNGALWKNAYKSGVFEL